MLYAREWEIVCIGTNRLKVPNGWLVSVEKDVSGLDDGQSISLSLCFVPDSNSCWELEDD